MKTYIAILRGVNVSGKNLLKMEALRKVLEVAGLKNVSTYIQSGNVLFEADEESTSNLAELIHYQVKHAFGYDVPVLVLSAQEAGQVQLDNPFINTRKEDISKLHVTLLSEIPSEALVSEILGLSGNPDEFIVHGKAIYLFCPMGYGNIKITNSFFEKKLKLTATTRNWRTFSVLTEKALRK